MHRQYSSTKKENNKQRRTDLINKLKDILSITKIKIIPLITKGWIVLAFFSILGFVFYFISSSQPQVEKSKPPLKLTTSKNVSRFYTAKGKADPLFQIELNKTELNRQLHELSNELLETKSRLIQLKKDILVRGGQKETAYLDKILKLESEQEKLLFESVEKDNSIAEKEGIIAELEEYNRKAENAFISQNEKFKEIQESTLKEHHARLADFGSLLSKINEELNLSEHLSFENVDVVLENFKNKSNDLIAEKESLIAGLEEENKKIKDSFVAQYENLQEIYDTTLNERQKKLTGFEALLSKINEELNLPEYLSFENVDVVLENFKNKSSSLIAEKEALITKLKEENKQNENSFIAQYENLQEIYDTTLNEKQAKLTGFETLLSKVNQELNLPEHLSFENVDVVLENFKNKSNSLIAEKEELITGLKEENKKFEDALIVQNGKLQEIYDNALSEYETKLADATAVLAKINEELNVSEYLSLENVDVILEKLKKEPTRNKAMGLSHEADIIADGFISTEDDSL